MIDQIEQAMKEVCDSANNFAVRWNHKGRCRICDESMETLVSRLNILSKLLENDND